MSDKEVIIYGKKMMHGTGVKGSRQTQTSSTPTFDGVITEGTRNVPHTIEITKVSYEGLTDYVTLVNTIEEMLDTPGIISVREKKYIPGEKPFVVIYNYHDCIVDGDDYEIKAEEKTVETLKFISARRTKNIKYL